MAGTAGTANAAPAASRFRTLLAWALLALGALRVLALLAHSPLAAYANQYDMARTSACLGLWPDRPAAEQTLSHPSAPIDAYRYGGETTEACFASTEVAVAWLAVQIDRVAESVRGRSEQDFTLHQLAWFKGLLVLAIALYLHARLARWPNWRAAHAAVFALIIADPFNMLFLGTLYTELEALLGTWLALGSLLAMRLCQHEGDRPPRDLPWLFALGLLALGTSRVPHALLPAWLLAVATLSMYSGDGTTRGTRLRCLLPALGTVLLALALPIHNARVHPEITRANNVDSLFGSVLPASDQPERLTQRLGLPPACAEPVFATWYRGRGHNPLGECPDALDLSRGRMLIALMREPASLLRLFGRGLMLSSQWRLPYLGEIAESDMARLHQPGTTAAIAPRSFTFQIMLWALAGWLLPWAAWRCRKHGDIAATLALGLTGIVAMVWAISVLGDGYSELTRHLHLAQNAILTLWLFALIRAIAWLIARRHETRRMTLGIGATAMAAVITFALAAAWARLPMAMGVFDVPDGAAALEHRFEASGWLLSTRGVDAARVRLGDGMTQDITLETDSALARFFAFGHGRTARRFHAVLDWPASVRSPADLHLEAREPGGPWREIDRVRVESTHEPVKMPAPSGPSASGQ